MDNEESFGLVIDREGLVFILAGLTYMLGNDLNMTQPEINRATNMIREFRAILTEEDKDDGSTMRRGSDGEEYA